MTDASKDSINRKVEYERLQRRNITTTPLLMNDINVTRNQDILKRESDLLNWLIKLSGEFVGICAANEDEVLNRTLSELGTLFEADRAYIFNFDFENQLFSNTFEWCSEGTKSYIEKQQNLRFDDFGYLIQSQISGENIQIYDISQYHDNDVRSFLEIQGIKSLVSIPLFNHDKTCLGFVGLDFVKKHQAITNKDLQLLQIYANLLITNIKQIENEKNLFNSKEQAEKNEEKFRLMIKNSSDSFVLINENAEQFYISDAAIRDTGFSIEELKGPIQNVIHPADLDLINNAWNEILNNKHEMLRVQYRHKHKFKDYIWYEAVCQNHLDNPAINAIVVNVRDITPLKEQELELIKSKERAEISDRLKSAFLANMSHEIRTPMNGILGFAELLKEPGLAGEQQLEFIKIIEKSGQRMLNIINDIIDISKIEAGLMNVNKREINVNKLVDYIFAFFSPEIKSKGLELSVESKIKDGDDTIITDHEKLYAVLTNLVKNAVKFTNSGKITIGYEKKEDYIEFYVKDTGIGITKDRQNIIFERFVQATNDNQMILQGAGLGLTITKAYVEILDGKIWFVSEEGVGSTFYFTLPCDTKQRCAGSENQTDRPGLDIALKDKLKILVAEDDQISKLLLEFMIKDISKEIIKASSGNEVVELCRSNPDIDLILMDIQMPEKNGYEAASEIRKFNSNVIIIAQTAFGLEGDKEKVIQAGCNDYISKPIKRKDLLKIIPRYFK